MVNPVQIGNAIDADSLGATSAAKNPEAPFAEALDTAMTLEKPGDAATSQSATASAANVAVMTRPVRAADKTSQDDPSAEVEAVLTALGAPQQTIALMPPVFVSNEVPGGQEVHAKFEPQSRIAAVEVLPVFGKNPKETNISNAATPDAAEMVSAVASVSKELQEILPETNLIAKSQGDDDATRLTPEILQNPVGAVKTSPESGTPLPNEQAATTVEADGISFCTSDVPSTHDRVRTLSNAKLPVAPGTSVVTRPNLSANLYPTGAGEIVAKKPDSRSLEGIVESPANLHSQGEETAKHVNPQIELMARDKHPELPDARPKAAAKQMAERKTLAIPAEIAKASPEAIQTSEETTVARASSSELATSSVPQAVVIDPMARETTPVTPAILLTSASANAQRHESTGMTVAASSKDVPADAIVMASTGVDVSQIREVIQSARILEHLGRAEMQVGINTDMGHVQVRTVLQNAHVSASFGVERSELGALISAELPSLQRALEKNHLDLSSASVNTSGASAQGDHGRNAQQQRNQNGAPGYPLPAIYSDTEDEPSRQAPHWMGAANESRYFGGLSVRA